MLAMFPPRMLAATKNPGLMGLMAKSVVHEDQGVLQGSIMSLRVLAKVRTESGERGLGWVAVVVWSGGCTCGVWCVVCVCVTAPFPLHPLTKPHTHTHTKCRRWAPRSSGRPSAMASSPASSSGTAPGSPVRNVCFVWFCVCLCVLTHVTIYANARSVRACASPPKPHRTRTPDPPNQTQPGITFFIAAGLDFLGLGIAALVFKYASPSIFTPPPEGAVAPHSGETAASSMEEGVEVRAIVEVYFRCLWRPLTLMVYTHISLPYNPPPLTHTRPTYSSGTPRPRAGRVSSVGTASPAPPPATGRPATATARTQRGRMGRRNASGMSGSSGRCCGWSRRWMT